MRGGGILKSSMMVYRGPSWAEGQVRHKGGSYLQSAEVE
jgi:hypothetical protein